MSRLKVDDIDDGNVDTDCYIDEDGSKDEFGDDQYPPGPIDVDEYEDVDLDKEEDVSQSTTIFDKSLIASRMLNDPKGSLFLFFLIYRVFIVCTYIFFQMIYLDIRSSTSSSIDFAIASTPTNQCISDQSLTTAGNNNICINGNEIVLVYKYPLLIQWGKNNFFL